MKLNNTLMLATLVAGGLVAGIPAQAQDASNAPAATRPPMRGQGFSTDTMATRLELTDDEKTKVKPVMDDMMKQYGELRTNKDLSQEDRRAKMKEIRDAASAKLKDILTPEQYTKWEKMGMGGRRQGAPNTPPATTPPTPPAAAPGTAQKN